MLDSVSLVNTIFGKTRGSVLPFAYAIDVTAKRIFVDRIPEEELKLCDDVCVEVWKRLAGPLVLDSVTRSVERWGKRCWEKLSASGQIEKYIGKPINRVESPRVVLIYLATYMYFEKPYFQVILEQPEMFMGRERVGLASRQSL